MLLFLLEGLLVDDAGVLLDRLVLSAAGCRERQGCGHGKTKRSSATRLNAQLIDACCSLLGRGSDDTSHAAARRVPPLTDRMITVIVLS